MAGVEAGQRARITLAEYPASQFEGRVTRSAGTLDSTSRTMNVEIQVPNPDHRLLPGMYASVALDIEQTGSALVVPATALIIGEQGVRVASVDGQGQVHLVPVVIERDRGADVVIASGLQGRESIIANPAPSIADGSTVQAFPKTRSRPTFSTGS